MRGRRFSVILLLVMPSIFAVTVPRKDIRRSETSNYAWMTTKWSECSSSCGGIRVRSVRCVDQHGLTSVSEMCHSLKPDTHQPCNRNKCNSTDFHPRSYWRHRVNSGYLKGTLSDLDRDITFKGTDIMNNQLSTDHAIQAIPEKERVRKQALTLDWTVSEWSACSVTCGGGFRVRSVRCLDECGIISPMYKRCNTSKPVRPSTFEFCAQTDCITGMMIEGLLPPDGATTSSIPDGSESVIVISTLVAGYMINHTITEADGTGTVLMETVTNGEITFVCGTQPANISLDLQQLMCQNLLFANGEFVFVLDCVETIVLMAENVTVMYENGTVTVSGSTTTEFPNITTFWYFDSFRFYQFNASKALLLPHLATDPTSKLFTSKNVALYSTGSLVNSQIEDFLKHIPPLPAFCFSTSVVVMTPTPTTTIVAPASSIPLTSSITTTVFSSEFATVSSTMILQTSSMMSVLLTTMLPTTTMMVTVSTSTFSLSLPESSFLFPPSETISPSVTGEATLSITMETVAPTVISAPVSTSTLITPTPTLTMTPTSTATMTPIPTPTMTATATATMTPIPTATVTPTPDEPPKPKTGTRCRKTKTTKSRPKTRTDVTKSTFRTRKTGRTDSTGTTSTRGTTGTSKRNTMNTLEKTRTTKNQITTSKGTTIGATKGTTTKPRGTTGSTKSRMTKMKGIKTNPRTKGTIEIASKVSTYKSTCTITKGKSTKPGGKTTRTRNTKTAKTIDVSLTAKTSPRRSDVIDVTRVTGSRSRSGSMRRPGGPRSRTRLTGATGMTESTMRRPGGPRSRTRLTGATGMTDSTMRRPGGPRSRTRLTGATGMTDSTMRRPGGPRSRTRLTGATEMTDSTMRRPGGPRSRTRLTGATGMTENKMRMSDPRNVIGMTRTRGTSVLGSRRSHGRSRERPAVKPGRSRTRHIDTIMSFGKVDTRWKGATVINTKGRSTKKPKKHRHVGHLHEKVKPTLSKDMNTRLRALMLVSKNAKKRIPDRNSDTRYSLGKADSVDMSPAKKIGRMVEAWYLKNMQEPHPFDSSKTSFHDYVLSGKKLLSNKKSSYATPARQPIRCKPGRNCKFPSHLSARKQSQGVQTSRLLKILAICEYNDERRYLVCRVDPETWPESLLLHDCTDKKSPGSVCEIILLSESRGHRIYTEDHGSLLNEVVGEMRDKDVLLAVIIDLESQVNEVDTIMKSIIHIYDIPSDYIVFYTQNNVVIADNNGNIVYGIPDVWHFAQAPHTLDDEYSGNERRHPDGHKRQKTQ